MKTALALLLLAAGPALGQGFAVADLTTLPPTPETLLGGPTVGRAEPGRLTLMCLECGDGSAVDLLLAPGSGDRGTEERLRSGETTAADLEALCRAREPACRIEALAVAPAVGWISAWPLGGTAVATAVILRDGDQLTVRSMGPDPATARRNADAVIGALVPQITGD